MQTVVLISVMVTSGRHGRRLTMVLAFGRAALLVKVPGARLEVRSEGGVAGGADLRWRIGRATVLVSIPSWNPLRGPPCGPARPSLKLPGTVLSLRPTLDVSGRGWVLLQNAQKRCRFTGSRPCLSKPLLRRAADDSRPGEAVQAGGDLLPLG